MFSDRQQGQFQRTKSLHLTIIAFACWGLFLAGCGERKGAALPDAKTDPIAAANPVVSGHQKMLDVLEKIRNETAESNSYLGDKNARKSRLKLELYSNSMPPMEKFRLLRQLGFEELVIGNEEAAIERFTEALDLISKARPNAVPTRLHFLLGLAYMRLGEVENCCANATPDSCIVPISGEGFHTQKRGSQNAIKYLKLVHQNSPENSQYNLDARWLLNIAHMTLGEYPHDVPEDYLIPPKSFQAKDSFPKFNNVSEKLGLNTFSLSGGAVCDDFNNDHYLDLIVSTWETNGQIQLFVNNLDGRFTDATSSAGLDGIYGGLNLIQADYNNDGFVDVFVLRGAWLFEQGQHPNSLLKNNGDGTFTDVTFDVGLGEVNYPTQTASWSDYDLDGDLDLYIGNEFTSNFEAPCQLFRNNGDGTFLDVAKQAGVENLRFAKSVVWGDFNADRYPDLYVSNLNEQNRLYQNNGDGTFKDVAPELSVSEPIRSFPAWFWDVNNDGYLDIFVSSYAANAGQIAAAYSEVALPRELSPCLYLGSDNGEFKEVAEQWGIAMPSIPMGSNFGDLNADGFLDFYLGTGDPHFKNIVPNLMFLNRNGGGFEDVTMAGGFGHLQKGHAVVFADVDNDGDQDVFEQLGGAYLGDRFYDALFENPGFDNHWIQIQLVGVESNRSAIGARIKLTAKEDGQSRSIYRWVNSGATFGANPLRQHVGLGKSSEIEELEIYWPKTDGTQTFTNVPRDCAIVIREGESEFETIELKKLQLGGK